MIAHDTWTVPKMEENKAKIEMGRNEADGFWVANCSEHGYIGRAFRKDTAVNMARDHVAHHLLVAQGGHV